jgi:hypothetical protein
MKINAYMWVGYPVAPRYELWPGVLEGIDKMFDKLVDAGFKGLVLGPFSALEDIHGKRSYGPFTSEIWHEALREHIGSKSIKINLYHAFKPNFKNYEGTQVKPIHVTGAENSGLKWFTTLLKEAKERGLKTYYLWMLACQISELAPQGVSEVTNVFDNKMDFLCLNTPGLAEYMKGYLKDILENYPDIDGVIVDHLEIPSYTSELLFTCFCEACKRKADKLGYDFERMKAAVLKFYSNITNLNETTIKKVAEGEMGVNDFVGSIMGDEFLTDWFKFRFETVNELADELRQVINDVNPHLEFHIDSVTTSFAPCSGVSFKALRRFGYMVNPKLYPATDLWGWRSRIKDYINLVRQNKSIDDFTMLKFIERVFGLIGISNFKTLNELYSKPLPKELFINELEKAALLFGSKHRIRPWLRIDYELVDEIRNMLKAIRESGVEGVFIRNYAAATQLKLKIIKEELNL